MRVGTCAAQCGSSPSSLTAANAAGTPRDRIPHAPDPTGRRAPWPSRVGGAPDRLPTPAIMRAVKAGASTPLRCGGDRARPASHAAGKSSTVIGQPTSACHRRRRPAWEPLLPPCSLAIHHGRCDRRASAACHPRPSSRAAEPWRIDDEGSDTQAQPVTDHGMLVLGRGHALQVLLSRSTIAREAHTAPDNPGGSDGRVGAAALCRLPPDRPLAHG